MEMIVLLKKIEFKSLYLMCRKNVLDMCDIYSKFVYADIRVLYCSRKVVTVTHNYRKFLFMLYL